MKKNIDKKFIVVIIALPLVIVLAWLLYTDKISFNFLSHASATPDYIVCPEDSNDTDCTVLYSGGQGLFKLFYDSSVALDLNKDGKIYIKIKEGRYTLEQQSLSSITNQERAWIVMKDQTKSVLIEGSGAVVLDGGSNIGGVYLKNSKDVTISGISFSNLVYSSTNKCTGIVESCPVGRGIVLDGSKLLFEKSSILDATNGSIVSLGASELVVDGSEIVNKTGIGILAKGSSKIVIKNKSVVTSKDSNAISLDGTATLTTSSTIDRNEISRTNLGSGVTGFTIYANGTMPLNLAKVNIKSYGGGLLATGGVDVRLSDSQITSGRVQKDTLISLRDASKISTMDKTSLAGGSYGILLEKTTQVTSISASDISENKFGIYILGGTNDSNLAKVSSIKTTTFKENSRDIQLDGRAEVIVNEGTIFDGGGITGTGDSYLKKITVESAEFKNTGISLFSKYLSSDSDLIIRKSVFSSSSDPSGSAEAAVYIEGKSSVSVENTKFQSHSNGIHFVSTGKLSVTDSIFKNNIIGVRATNAGDVQLYRNKFVSNTLYGVKVGVSTNTDVRNNIFDGNETGISFGGNYEGSLINNVLANSKTSAVTFFKDTKLVRDYNNVYYKNAKHVTAVGTGLQSVSGFNVYYPSTTALFVKFTPQVTSIKADPKLDESTWKPLSTDSIVINAGNPDATYNDIDKSRNDIGITGGPKATSTDTVVPPEVVFSAIWNFNEAKDGSCTGGGDACDSGPKSFHGSVKGVAKTVSTPNGSGRDFDGKTGTYIEIGDKSEFELQTFTIEAVVKKEGNSGAVDNFYTILSKGGNGLEGFKFGLKGTDSLPIIVLNDGYSKKGKTVVKKNEWYHLAVVVDGSSKKVSLYVNGALDVSDSFSDPIKYGSAKVKIGNGNTNNDLGLDGVLDNVAFYSKVRTADEIKASYEAMIGPVSDTCGNGKKETSKGEKCDDGNLKEGDGCNAKCKYEADLNRDGSVSISGDYVPLYKAIKKYLSERKVTDTTYDLNGDGAITINGDYIIFLRAYKYYLKSLL